VKFWQASAYLDPAHMVPLARASEAARFDGLMVSDHIVFPETLSSPYPYTDDGSAPFDRSTPWLDAWVTVGAMATATSTLRFSTNVYVAGARNVFVVAKAVATAAVLSDDRVALGVGAGWMREEFELLGERFEKRGRRLDEMLGVMRRLWGGDWVEHHGEFYDFDRVSMTPVPQRSIPVWVGGESDAALRRAARNDGWIGGLYGVDEAFSFAERVVKARRDEGRETGDDFEVLLAVMAPLNDLDLIRRLEEAGVTGLVTAPWMLAEPSLQARTDAVARYGDEVIAKL
jgi:probable F420-dependent oxidoreductase